MKIESPRPNQGHKTQCFGSVRGGDESGLVLCPERQELEKIVPPHALPKRLL